MNSYHTHTVDGIRSGPPEYFSSKPDVHVHRLCMLPEATWLDEAYNDEEHRHVVRVKGEGRGLTPVEHADYIVTATCEQEEVATYTVRARSVEDAVESVRRGQLVGLSGTRQNVVVTERIVRARGSPRYGGKRADG